VHPQAGEGQRRHPHPHQQLAAHPPYVHDTCTHILAANTLATALCPFLTPPGRNAILDAFTEPEMRELRPDWDIMTARVVPHLRSITGAETGDPRLVELVGELSLRSERFRTLWARQGFKHNTTGASLFNHPQVGPRELNYERLLIAGSGMLALVTYHAQPGSDSEERLRLLDSITTTGPPTPVRPRPARPRQPRTTSQRDGIPGRHCYADTLHASSPAGAPAPGERLRALRPRRATTDNQRQPNSGLE
jgi:hypothetical protein